MSDASFETACHRSVRALQLAALPLERLDLPPPTILDTPAGRFYRLDPSCLERLAAITWRRLQFGFPLAYLQELASLLTSPSASDLDRFVLRQLLANARASADGIYPTCQDTGTAILYGWKGDRIITDSPDDDRFHFERGMLSAWRDSKLRSSQLLPLAGAAERNSGDNSPLAAELYTTKGDCYELILLAKGGGSANKSRLWQETKALLEPARLRAFLADAINDLGVSACPPYGLALAIGGQSAEQCLSAVKLASLGALDALPTAAGDGPWRDLVTEALLLELAASSGWGAQFGGTAMARSARVIRLPRHAASLPVGLGLSCAAHRQLHARIGPDGLWLESVAEAADIDRLLAYVDRSLAGGRQPQANSGRPADVSACPPDSATPATGAVGGHRSAADLPAVNLDDWTPGAPLTAALTDLRAGQLVRLSGSVILARDAAHARLRRLLAEGKSLPDWARFPLYYASPTETQEGCVIGSLGPTTARRMDGYVAELMQVGCGRLMLGKGERGTACAEACREHGGMYFAAVGGAAALGARDHVSAALLLDWPELGMEAVRRVTLKDLPALVAIDAQGNDYYNRLPTNAPEKETP
ncbi:MAG TPA: fumarate hydratase [Spirochaetaceae bacterium]|nr:fumarate hydratase [Spirochaetaceae bacterium]